MCGSDPVPILFRVSYISSQAVVLIMKHSGSIIMATLQIGILVRVMSAISYPAGKVRNDSLPKSQWHHPHQLICILSNLLSRVSDMAI